MEFHRQVRTYLDLFDELAHDARHYGRVGRARAQALADFFSGPLMAHDTDEETLLLPLMRRQGDDPILDRLLRVCTNGHEKLESRLEQVLPALRELAADPDEPNVSALTTAAREIRSLLESHMRLEETSLFPHAREILGGDDLRALGDELRTLEEERRTGAKRVKQL
jgi:hemerythrin-like domain-containing protein